jgi:hypothetical protein
MIENRKFQLACPAESSAPEVVPKSKSLRECWTEGVQPSPHGPDLGRFVPEPLTRQAPQSHPTTCHSAVFVRNRGHSSVSCNHTGPSDPPLPDDSFCNSTIFSNAFCRQCIAKGISLRLKLVEDFH